MILYKSNPVIQDQIIAVRKKAERYKLLEYTHKIEISGQGQYEITVKNLVNLITMKSLTNLPQDNRKQLLHQEQMSQLQQSITERTRIESSQILPKVLAKILNPKIKTVFKEFKHRLRTLK